MQAKARRLTQISNAVRGAPTSRTRQLAGHAIKAREEEADPRQHRARRSPQHQHRRARGRAGKVLLASGPGDQEFHKVLRDQRKGKSTDAFRPSTPGQDHEGQKQLRSSRRGIRCCSRAHQRPPERAPRALPQPSRGAAEGMQTQRPAHRLQRSAEPNRLLWSRRAGAASLARSKGVRLPLFPTSPRQRESCATARNPAAQQTAPRHFQSEKASERFVKIKGCCEGRTLKAGLGPATCLGCSV